MPTYKIAGVQMDIRFGEVEANLNAMEHRIRETTSAGAWLTVFPECTTTGYCFDSLEAARQIADPIDGPTVKLVQDMCSQFATKVIFGFLELEGAQVFNSLALIDSNGILGTYRKIHLPTLGVDRFTTSGNHGFSVIDLPEMKIGMNICYDCSFPESARVLALRGADLIVLPTNWPPTSGLTADVIPAARALENHVYFMAINRIGNERGFEFIGKSSIHDPRGAKLAMADHRDEAILYAEIDPEFSRSKHLINIPGEHEVHRIDDRKPKNYHDITRSRSH